MSESNWNQNCASILSRGLTLETRQEPMKMDITNRKVIANIFLTIFLVSRAADVSATVLLSEGLKHEGNPVVFWLGGTWWSVALLSLIFVGMFIHLWWKLRTHEYQKTTENIGLLKKIMSLQAWSAESQVRIDVFSAIFFTAIGFAASLIWVVEFGLEKKWLSWKSSLAVGESSSTLTLIMIVSVVISFCICRMKSLTNCFLERPG